jgi:hypothetical protein
MINIHSNLPAHIEAAISYLRFTEEICNPSDYGGAPKSGRKLSKTEFEVKDSALIVLLEYFNQPILNSDLSRPMKRPSNENPNGLG